MKKDSAYWTKFNKQNEKKWKVIFDDLQKEVETDLCVDIKSDKDFVDHFGSEKTAMYLSFNQVENLIGVDEVLYNAVRFKAFNHPVGNDEYVIWFDVKQIRALKRVLEVILENAIEKDV